LTVFCQNPPFLPIFSRFDPFSANFCLSPGLVGSCRLFHGQGAGAPKKRLILATVSAAKAASQMSVLQSVNFVFFVHVFEKAYS
jgi:hypothetical protein